MDYAHYQAQLAHAAGLPTLVQSGSQTLAAVSGHNLTGGAQNAHPSISQAVVSAAQLATVSYESMLTGSTSPAIYTAGMHMGTANTQHHNMGHIRTQVHTSKSNKKRPKVNKDGIPAPKRATTAYINFTQWYREEIKKQGRTVPRIGDFGKECAGKWNNMGDEDKTPFVATANKDRERYKKEMAVYKPVRDVNKPKRPGTAFMIFMGDFRKEMAGREPEGGVAALAKLGGERWRGMTEEDKRPYVEKQSVEKIKYEANMEEYRRKQSAESNLAKLPGIANANAGPTVVTVITAAGHGEAEDNDSIGLVRPASTESNNSPHTPTTPNSNDNVITHNQQLQQQIQQMVAASQTQNQQLTNIAPPPAHSSSAALDFSTQHGGSISYQTAAAAAATLSGSHHQTTTAINYSQAIQQQQQQQQQPQQQQPQQTTQQQGSPEENTATFNSNQQTAAAAPNYNQAHMAGHYGWV